MLLRSNVKIPLVFQYSPPNVDYHLPTLYIKDTEVPFITEGACYQAGALNARLIELTLNSTLFNSFALTLTSWLDS